MSYLSRGRYVLTLSQTFLNYQAQVATALPSKLMGRYQSETVLYTALTKSYSPSSADDGGSKNSDLLQRCKQNCSIFGSLLSSF